MNQNRLCSTLCLTSTRLGFHRSLVLSRSQSSRFSQSSRPRRLGVRWTYVVSMRSACRILWLHQQGTVRGPVPERMDAKGRISADSDVVALLAYKFTLNYLLGFPPTRGRAKTSNKPQKLQVSPNSQSPGKKGSEGRTRASLRASTCVCDQNLSTHNP